METITMVRTIMNESSERPCLHIRRYVRGNVVGRRSRGQEGEDKDRRPEDAKNIINPSTFARGWIMRKMCARFLLFI